MSNQPYSDSVLSPSTADRSLWYYLEKPITGLLLTLALSLLADSLPRLQAQGSELPATASSTHSPAVLVADSARDTSLPNGTHLFGQSPQAAQLNSTYVVLEVNDSQVVGAFYMPHSSFDCFQGEVQAEHLALTITDSYDQARYPYSVALQQQAAVATANDAAIASVGLTGFHAIANFSETDQRILNVCKQQVRQ